MLRYWKTMMPSTFPLAFLDNDSDENSYNVTAVARQKGKESSWDAN